MLTRPLSCKYDPLISKISEQKATDSDVFSVLSFSGPLELHGLKRYQHSIPINPKALGVPWHSTAPFVRRSIYWDIAEEQASKFFNTIMGQHVEEQCDRKNSSVLHQKESKLLDVAMSYAINLWPDASERRMCLIAQAMCCIFLHDDIKELDSRSTSVLDASCLAQQNGTETNSNAKNGGEISNVRNVVNELRDNIIAEDPETGIAFWNSIMRWAQHGETYSNNYVAKHDSLRSYMDYRANDFGVDITDTGLRWGYALTLSPTELQCSQKLTKLLHDHTALTNDLYSFDKEYKEHITKGFVLVNAVAVMMELHSLSEPAAAKNMVWEIIRDIENRMCKEYVELKASKNQLNAMQWRYIDATLECAVGNLFTSATIARYGGY